MLPLRVAILTLASLSCALAARIEHVAGGQQAGTDIDAGQVKLSEPFGVEFGSNGDWYICEHTGHRILRVDKAGKAHAFAGTGSPAYGGDGGPAIQATFRQPHGIAMSKHGAMYVADTFNNTVRRIDMKAGTITTVAGTGEKGFSGDGGPGTKATFNGTFGIALNLQQDKLYIADLNDRRIRSLDLKSGTVTTVAGNGQEGEPADGAMAKESPLVDPRAVAVDRKGTLYILERRGNALRAVDGKGRIKTLIRPGSLTPNLNGPKHLFVDRSGNVIIADTENHLIRRYDAKSGQVSTLAGSGQKGAALDATDALRTELSRPHGVIVDAAGALYISDSDNHRVLKMSSF